jgi:hypothetical protein
MNSYFDAFSFLFKNNASNKKTCFCKKQNTIIRKLRFTYKIFFKKKKLLSFLQIYISNTSTYLNKNRF